MANCGQYFKCVSKNNFSPESNIIVLGLLAGGLAIMDVVAAVLSGSAIPGVGIVAGVLFVAAIFELCAFLHGGKLICLGEEVCTIGRIMELIPVGADKSGFEKLDDDFTINILPSPHSPIESAAEVAMVDPHQGRYLTPQPESQSLGLGFEGVSVKFDKLDKATDVFHVEVKGCRVHDVCGVLKVMSFGAPILGFVCSIPVIGWIACAIAAAVWMIITAAAVAIAWANAHVGDVNDVYDPAAGALLAADSATGEGGDVILVMGDWVYDAGHAGWNEIHPVRQIHKLTGTIDPRFRSMDKADAALVAAFEKEVLDVWCYRVKEARDPLVVDAQQAPENQWKIHPAIDGCESEPVIK